MSNPFGKSAKTGYISENVKDADNLSYGRLKGALGNVQDPKEYSAGNSSMGFGNTLFNQKYNPYQFQNTTATPYQFKMPDALSGKGGVYGETMNNMQRGLLRQAKGGTDEMMRNAKLTGSYSPGMMKNVLMKSQNQTQEALGDYGSKGALDLASEQARADESRQLNQANENLNVFKQNLVGQGMQAEENQKARELDLEAGGKALMGEEIGLKDDFQKKQYFMDLMKQLFQSHIDPYAGQKGGTPASQGWLPQAIDMGTKVAGTVAKFM